MIIRRLNSSRRVVDHSSAQLRRLVVASVLQLIDPMQRVLWAVARPFAMPGSLRRRVESMVWVESRSEAVREGQQVKQIW